MIKYLLSFFVLLSSATYAGDTLSNKGVTLYLGGGYNHYINNMEVLSTNIDPMNYGLNARLMWEPKHRLSVGLETGYIQMYQWDAKGLSKNTSLFVVPIFLNMNMRLIKRLYTTFGFGSALFITKTQNKQNSFTTNNLQFANINIGLGYKIMLTKKLSLNIETDYLYLSKANDMSVMGRMMMGWRF
jgi:Outer membrane protein beta-barrel domain